MIYQMLLSNLAPHFAAADGLAAMPGWAQRAELQLEFAVTEIDRNGARFAPQGSPGAWLAERGVEVWYYVNPTAPVLLASQSQVQAEESPLTSPFWWRVQQANAIIGRNWLLRNRDGEVVMGYGRNRPVADIGNPAYIDWLSDAIIATGVRRVRLDDFTVHQHAFHRPMRASWQDGGDSAGLLGMRALCTNLRAEGIRVLANGAWEMSNPDLPPDKWHYPMAGYVDGVMIELLHKPPEGSATTGFARWSGGRFWTMGDEHLAVVIEQWQRIGADVTLAVTWRGGQDGTTFEQFARKWYQYAIDHDCYIFTGRDDRPNKATHQVDKFSLPVPEPEPEPQPDMGAELQRIRLDINAATALLNRAVERLRALEGEA